MKYIGLFDEKEDIVTKEKLDAVASRVSTNEDNIAMAESDIDGLQTDVGTLQTNVTNVQTALASKQDTVVGGASTITEDNLTASRALVSNSSGKVAVSTVTSTELGYLDGVTSNVQTQLDSKQPTITVNGIIKGDGAGNLSAQDTVAAELVDLPTVPTKVSELTNDANYITAAQAPVQSVNGKTGYVTVSTTFVAYRLGNSSATCTFAEMMEAWKRGDICILRYGADGMLEYQLFAVVDNESITFAYVDGDIIREIVWTADGNFTDNNIEKSTNLSDSSTNSQFPTSKAVWDAIPRPSTTTPLAPTEAGSVGTSAEYARGDHSHPKELPNVTTADNGKFLRVVNGTWAAVEIANANGGSF